MDDELTARLAELNALAFRRPGVVTIVTSPDSDDSWVRRRYLERISALRKSQV